MALFFPINSEINNSSFNKFVSIALLSNFKLGDAKPSISKKYNKIIMGQINFMIVNVSNWKHKISVSKESSDIVLSLS